jgi:HD-like signal output (HDOD) protein
MAPSSRDVTSLAKSLTRIRPFPTVVDAIRRTASNPASGVGDVVRYIEADVGVATDVLRVANAPASALAQKCTSIRHAASLLGMRRVVEVVTGAAALARIEKASIAYPELGAHVLAVAGVVRTLAPITGVSPDEAFTAGLLHDIGVLMLVESEDPFYEGLIDSGTFVDEPSIDDERVLMGFDHAALGEAIARAWSLPSPLPRVIGLHHDWPAALKEGGVVSAIVALLRVGDVLVPLLRTHTNPSLDDLLPLSQEPAFEHLGLKREEMHRMWEVLRAACDKAHSVAVSASEEFHPVPTVGPDSSPRSERGVVLVSKHAGDQMKWGVAAAAVLLVAGALGILMLLVH